MMIMRPSKIVMDIDIFVEDKENDTSIYCNKSIWPICIQNNRRYHQEMTINYNPLGRGRNRM